MPGFGSIFGLVTVGAAAGVVIYTELVSKRQLLRDLKGFDDLKAADEGWGHLSVETTQATPSVRIVSAGGAGDRAHWDCMSTAPLAKRTTLRIERQGVISAAREKLGQPDVHVGDSAFDREFCIRGSNNDLVRGVCQRAAVQGAIRTLFEDKEIRYVEVREQAALYAWSWRASYDAARLRQKIHAVQALAAALIDAADAQPVAGVRTVLGTSGLGALSGAPVGISIGDRR